MTLEIPGEPVPKGRPRKGKGGRFYTPDRTRKAEEAVAWAARACRQTFTGPVRVSVDFYGSLAAVEEPAE